MIAARWRVAIFFFAFLGGGIFGWGILGALGALGFFLRGFFGGGFFFFGGWGVFWIESVGKN